MDYHVFKSMLNRYYSRHVGGERRPVFFDIGSSFPNLQKVTEGYPKIREEFERLLDAQTPMPRYHDIDVGEAEISATTDHNWKVFMLDVLGHKPQVNRALCPETCRCLDAVPDLLQAFFSILDPGKSIPLHVGPYLGYLRYHLALRVPTENPPKLRVGPHEYVWKEGEAVLFDDTWPHAVENTSHGIRAVLIIDVLRPMPRIPHFLNRVTTRFIAAPTYGRKLAEQVAQFALPLEQRSQSPAGRDP